MDKQNDTSARDVELKLLSNEETRKLWKDYQDGTLDKFMYGDLPLGWSQVISKAQAAITRDETLQEAKLRQLEANEFIRHETLRKVGERLLTFSKKHTQFDMCTMELLVDADLFFGFRDTLLKGEMPEQEGSPAPPPDSESKKP